MKLLAALPLVVLGRLTNSTSPDDEVAAAVSAAAKDMGLPTEAEAGSISAMSSGKTELGVGASAASGLLPGSTGSNYQDGFNRPVLAKPLLKTRLYPIVDNLNYEESVMRSKALQSINAALVAERPKVIKLLRAHAQKEADTEAQTSTATNAKAAAKRAFSITKGLVGRKASSTCASLSHLKQLPAECQVEAEKAFANVENLADKTWVPASVKATQAATATGVRTAALKSVVGLPDKLMPPAAYAAASKIFASEWPKYVSEYRGLTSGELAALEAAKDSFWQKAETALMGKVKAAVKKAVWAAPVTAAKEKIKAVAAKAAVKAATKAVTAEMAPKFAQAAQAALTQGVRKASTSSIDSWSPKWDMNPSETVR